MTQFSEGVPRSHYPGPLMVVRPDGHISLIPTGISTPLTVDAASLTVTPDGSLWDVNLGAGTNPKIFRFASWQLRWCACGRLTRGRTRRGPASARRPSRLVQRYLNGVTPPASRASKCGNAACRCGFGTRALAPRVNLLTVRRTTIRPRLHASTAPTYALLWSACAAN